MIGSRPERKVNGHIRLNGPTPTGRQQWGILDNGGNLIQRRRVVKSISVCKALSAGKK